MAKKKSKERVIRSSRLWLIVYLVIAVLMTTGGLIVITAAGATDGEPLFHLRVGAVLFGGGLGIPLLVHVLMWDWDWLLRRKLVITKDALQMVGLTGSVVGQLPWENVVKIDTQFRGGGDNPRTVIEITIGKKKDEETWWPRYRGRGGKEIHLKDRWAEPANVVARLLQAQYDRYWKERGDDLLSKSR
jgi:hypothetical protein